MSGDLLSFESDVRASDVKSNTLFSLEYCSDVMVLELAQKDDANDVGQSAF